MNRKWITGTTMTMCGLAASVAATVLAAGCGGADPLTSQFSSGDMTLTLDSGKSIDSGSTNAARLASNAKAKNHDGGPACPSAQTMCGDTCVTTARDSENCGACGNTCAGGEVCSAGICATTCGGSDSLCSPDGGAPYCARFASDNANCGGCGVTCGIGEACSAGACATTCGSSQTLCNAGASGDGGSDAAPPSFDAGPAYCATLASDEQNCGACGNACGAGQSCTDGQCETTCGVTQILCAPEGSATYCADYMSDNANCGECGHSCGDGTVCSGGQCTTTCGEGLIDCNGGCIDPSSSVAYCGATDGCGNDAGSAGTACATGKACSAGSCVALSEYEVGSFNVDDGPWWSDEAPAYSCVAACALVFGGDASGYGCSTVEGSLNHQAWGSNNESGAHCAGGTPVADNYSNGDIYLPGVFSAYIGDNCGWGSVNYCWAVPPAIP